MRCGLWIQIQYLNILNYHILIMNFHRLMTKKFAVTLFLILTVQAQTHDDDHDSEGMTMAQSWGFGILSGIGIILSAFLGSILIVWLRGCIANSTFKVVVSLLYALGCGALLGDAIVHILPQAYHNTEVNSNIVSLIFILAITTFIIIERLLAACGITHQHCGEFQHQDCQHGHPHSNQKRPQQPNLVASESIAVIQPNAEELPETRKAQDLDSKKRSFGQMSIKNKATVANEAMPSSSQEIRQTETGHCAGCCFNLKGKHSAGYMAIMSEITCIFFDGFAIGVGFASRDSAAFVPLLIAVYAHEIPTLMGNVGLLLKSGFTNCQTIVGNSVISCIGLLGIVLGLGLGEISDSVQTYVLTFVAGNFVYIAAEMWKKMMKSKMACQSFAEFISFGLGIGIMFLILLVQGDAEHNH